MRKKRLTLLLALTAVVLCSLGGCSRKEGIKGNRHHHAAKGFSIKIPFNWVVTKDTEGGLDLMAVGTTEGVVNVATEQLGGPVSLEQYFQHRAPFKELATGDTTIDNMPAKWRVLLREVTGIRIKAIQYMLVSDGRVFVICGVAIPEMFGKSRRLFEDIVQTFKVESVQDAG
jgi:hypothetical protein